MAGFYFGWKLKNLIFWLRWTQEYTWEPADPSDEKVMIIEIKIVKLSFSRTSTKIDTYILEKSPSSHACIFSFELMKKIYKPEDNKI